MSTDPATDGPLSREAPPPPGTETPQIVEELESRIEADVKDAARDAGTDGEPGGPAGDVVPDTAQTPTDGGSGDGGSGDGGSGDGVAQETAADPTLAGDEDQDADTTDGMPRSEPTD